jgi:hypothetical protein
MGKHPDCAQERAFTRQVGLLCGPLWAFLQMWEPRFQAPMDSGLRPVTCFSRLYGAKLGNGVLTHALKAGFPGSLPVWGRSAVGEIVRGKRGMRGNSHSRPQWRLQQLLNGTQDCRPRLSSAVHTGLSFEMEFSHALKPDVFSIIYGPTEAAFI